MANKPKSQKPTDESVREARIRMEASTEHALAVVGAEKALEEQANRKLLAVHYSGLLAGQMMAHRGYKLLSAHMEGKKLAELREGKKYLGIPGIESFDQYLDMLGAGRSTAYENIKIASAFTPDDVQNLDKIGLTRRDLLGLASLTDEQRLQIREGQIINLEKADREEIRQMIEDLVLENKKVKEDHAADLRAAEKHQGKLNEALHKAQKDIDKYERKAKSKGLTLEEDAFLQEMENLRIGFDGYMLRCDPVRIKFDGEPTIRMTAALIETIGYFRRQIHAAYDTATEMYGDRHDDDGFVFTPPKGKGK